MPSSEGQSELLREIAELSGLSQVFRQHTIEQACRRSGVTSARPTREEIRKALPEIARSLRIFLGAEESARRLGLIEARLHDGEVAHLARRTLSFDAVREADIGAIRNQVRDLCLQLGAKDQALQKACTISSELTRNMVAYAGGGKLTIDVVRIDGRVALRMKARDHGPGIPNLEAVLSGRYRSKTGLGLGILGTKRLADGFQVETGAGGTLISVEVRL